MHALHSFSCHLCKYPLSPPVMSSKTCIHNFHKKCFFGVLENAACPKCNIEVTGGRRNSKLENVIVKLQHFSLSMIHDPSGASPKDKLFHEATKEGDELIMEVFLEEGVLVDTLVEGCSALFIACKYEQVRAARLLLEKGATPNKRNEVTNRLSWHMNAGCEHNMTPMEIAVAKGNIELVELLIRYHVAIDEISVEGNSFLFTALHFRQEEMALFLIRQGIDIRKKDGNGNPPLLVAVRCNFFTVVQELLTRGVDINEATRNGTTALHAAAEKDTKLLSFLLENGAAEVINSRCRDIWTPLTIAIAGAHVDNVMILVANGANALLEHDTMSALDFAQEKWKNNKNLYHMRPQCTQIEAKTVEKRHAIVKFLSNSYEDHAERKECIESERPDLPNKKKCTIS